MTFHPASSPAYPAQSPFVPIRVSLPQPSLRELFQHLGFHFANYSEGWDYEAWTGWMNGTEPKPEIK